MKTRTLIAAVALIAPMLAAAQTTSTPRIDQRQANQDARIQQGTQSGALTQKGDKLDKGQTHVQNMENKAMADGTVTKKEAGRIEHAQDQQSKRVYREARSPARLQPRRQGSIAASASSTVELLSPGARPWRQRGGPFYSKIDALLFPPRDGVITRLTTMKAPKSASSSSEFFESRATRSWPPRWCRTGPDAAVHQRGHEPVQGRLPRLRQSAPTAAPPPRRSACAPAASTTTWKRRLHRASPPSSRCSATSRSATTSSATRSSTPGNC